MQVFLPEALARGREAACNLVATVLRLATMVGLGVGAVLLVILGGAVGGWMCAREVGLAASRGSLSGCLGSLLGSFVGVSVRAAFVLLVWAGAVVALSVHAFWPTNRHLQR